MLKKMLLLVCVLCNYIYAMGVNGGFEYNYNLFMEKRNLGFKGRREFFGDSYEIINRAGGVIDDLLNLNAENKDYFNLSST